MNPESQKQRLLVHACCASCSTVPLQRLSERYDLGVFFYGPNIHPDSEYRRRLFDQRRLCESHGVRLYEGDYDPEAWERAVGPFRHQAENSHGQRCQACYRLRMEQTSRLARREGFDLFTVTMSVSRHKDSKVLAEIGSEVAREHGLTYLPEDFSKRDGYALSVRHSEELGLYRQDFCGCVLSKTEAALRRMRRRADGS